MVAGEQPLSILLLYLGSFEFKTSFQTNKDLLEHGIYKYNLFIIF